MWSQDPQVVVRILGEDGQYPTFDIRRRGHLLVSSSPWVWSAVIQNPLGGDWEFGETYSLTPEEIRLHTAVSLCESNPWENGYLFLTLKDEVWLPLTTTGPDLTGQEAMVLLEEQVHQLALRAGSTMGPGHSQSAQYRFHTAGDQAGALLLLDAIDGGDQLLLAGLNRLLSGLRLLASGRFREEASLSLFISMGAALEFIRQRLSSSAGNPTVEDVRSYLQDTFPHGDQVVEFFDEMYDLRITATHPSNRFGDFWQLHLKGQRGVAWILLH